MSDTPASLTNIEPIEPIERELASDGTLMEDEFQ